MLGERLDRWFQQTQLGGHAMRHVPTTSGPTTAFADSNLTRIP